MERWIGGEGLEVLMDIVTKGSNTTKPIKCKIHSSKGKTIRLEKYLKRQKRKIKHWTRTQDEGEEGEK